MKPINHPENSGKSHRMRQDIRIPASILVDVSFDNGRAVFGKLEDLSLNGAKLRLPVYLSSGSPLMLDLANHQLSIKATCRWVRSDVWNLGFYVTGVCFNEINTEQYTKLRQILFNLAG